MQSEGFPDLTNSEREMVEGGSILWLRMMTVYLVAEETARRRSLPTVAYGQEQPRDPGDYRVDIPRENLVSCVAVPGVEGVRYRMGRWVMKDASLRRSPRTWNSCGDWGRLQDRAKAVKRGWRTCRRGSLRQRGGRHGHRDWCRHH